jgi:DNA-binding CsgD family transcriptional regulator
MAEGYARQAHQIGQAAGDRWFLAYVLNTLGDIAAATKQYGPAQQHYQAAFDMRWEFNDAEGMAVALNHLGDVAYRQASYSEAREFFEQGLHHYQNINDRGGLATSHQGLGCTALALGNTKAAREHFCRALQLASTIWYMPVVLNTLISIGELLCRAGQPQRGIGLLAQVEHHPAASQENKTRAAHLRHSFKLQLRPKELATTIGRAQSAGLESTISTLLVDLPTLDLTAARAGADAPPADPNQTLVEPLTDRELEVLHLLAEGLSNQQIADRLTLAEGTVKYYTRQIYGKFQVHNRVQAVALARELGLV